MSDYAEDPAAGPETPEMVETTIRSGRGRRGRLLWIEWPDEETRDAAFARMTDWMNNPEQADPRMDPEKNPMPFDGKRMIFGGFNPVVGV